MAYGLGFQNQVKEVVDDYMGINTGSSQNFPQYTGKVVPKTVAEVRAALEQAASAETPNDWGHDPNYLTIIESKVGEYEVRRRQWAVTDVHNPVQNLGQEVYDWQLTERAIIAATADIDKKFDEEAFMVAWEQLGQKALAAAKAAFTGGGQ